MTDRKSPAMRGHDGRSVSVQLGGIEQAQHTADAVRLQLAAYREADARLQSALALRGGERLRCIAIAACLRNAAYQAGISGGASA